MVIANVALAPELYAAFTWDDIPSRSDWRENLCWPIVQSEIAAVGAQVPQVLIAASARLADPFERQLAVVAFGLFANGFMALLEAAWACQGAAEQGLELRGGPAEMRLLAEGRSDFAVEEYRGPFNVKPVPKARLRAVARTASWTPPLRMPRALIRPEAIAISYNSLLQQAAKDRAIGFRHAADIVARLRRTKTEHSPGGFDHISEQILDALLPLVPQLRQPYRDRLKRVFVARIGNALSRVASDLELIRKARLPQSVWSGTNGAYATRLLTSEVMRRGGHVESFDHGGVTGISQLVGSTAVIELCTTRRFHVATPAWADLLKSTEALSIVGPINAPHIVGDTGEPTFKAAFRDNTARKGQRLRVIYIGHPYRGRRQFPLVSLPDLLYWDFQDHIVEILNSLNIEFLCKPHPEGYFKGRKNPIAAIAPTSFRRFEEHLDDADVFLFDAPTSTTFMEALCTRRRVILIDRGYPLNGAIRPAIARRCDIVRTFADTHNRIRVDMEELEAALLAGKADPDPEYFRGLTAGDALYQNKDSKDDMR